MGSSKAWWHVGRMTTDVRSIPLIAADKRPTGDRSMGGHLMEIACGLILVYGHADWLTGVEVFAGSLVPNPEKDSTQRTSICSICTFRITHRKAVPTPLAAWH